MARVFRGRTTVAIMNIWMSASGTESQIGKMTKKQSKLPYYSYLHRRI